MGLVILDWVWFLEGLWDFIGLCVYWGLVWVGGEVSGDVFLSFCCF